MAAPGPPQSMPPSSSASGPQQPPLPTHSDQITWDGDKMFNIYILDYCKKRGYRKTASELVIEAEIAPDSKPPINAQQGLLFEWWSVFWVLFQAKNNGAGSEDAMLYHKHQTQMKLRAGQVPPPGVPTARYSLPNGVPGPVPPLSASHINGIGPGGQPQSLTAPSPYGPPNPAAQPNGIPGPPQAPPGGAPGQQFPGGMGPRPPLGPQHQQRPNGPQYRSPTIAPSPQSQGNPQPPAGAMGQLGRSPHMSTMNRTAMPPPNGPQHQQGPGPVGSAHPTPTPSYQQLGRPPSSHDISSQNPMNPHRSPALSGRMPPGQDRSLDNACDAELATYPPDVLSDAKRHAGLGDRDTQSLTTEEKHTVIQHGMRLRQNQQNSGVAGPSAHGQLQSRGPMAQPMQPQLSRIKRNSTSPGEEHSALPRNDQSPPDRKRPRRTPTAEQQQQQHQQQQPQQQQQQQHQQQQQQHSQSQQTQQPPQHQPPQPPMAPIGPLPPGPQHMSGTGSVRGPLPMGGGQPPPNGFGVPPMHQMGMAGPMTPMHAMSPGMGHGPPMSVINPQQMGQPQMLYQQGQYRPGLMNPHKGNPNVPGPPLDPQSQAHLRGPGPAPNRGPGPLVPTQPGQPPKVIGGPMPPPGQPGMSGPSKPGGKDGEGELNAPLNPAASTPTNGPHHNSAPPMNSQRPPTASAQLPTPAPSAPGPGPMGDLSFDMTDMFGSTAGDFDFGTGSLGDMELWFDPSAVHDASIDMK